MLTNWCEPKQNYFTMDQLKLRFYKLICVFILCTDLVQAGVLQYGLPPVYKSPYIVDSPVKFLPYFQSQQYQQPLVVKAVQTVPYLYHDIQPLVYSSNSYQASQPQSSGYQDSYQSGYGSGSGNNNGFQGGYNYQSSGVSNLNGGYQSDYLGYNKQGTTNNLGNSNLGGYSSPEFNQGAYNNPGSSNIGAFNLNNNNLGAYNLNNNNLGNYNLNNNNLGNYNLNNNNLGNYNLNNNNLGSYNTNYNTEGAYNNDDYTTHDRYNQNNVNNIQSQYEPNSFGNSIQSLQTPSKYSTGFSNLGNSQYTSSSLAHSGDAALNDGRTNNNYQFSNIGSSNINEGPLASGNYPGPSGSGVGLTEDSYSNNIPAQVPSGPSGSFNYPQSSSSNTATVVEKIQAIDKTKEFEQIRKITSNKNIKESSGRKSTNKAVSAPRLSSSLKTSTNSLTAEPETEIIVDPSKSEIFGQRINPGRGRSRNRSLNSPEITTTTTTTTTSSPPGLYLPPERRN